MSPVAKVQKTASKLAVREFSGAKLTPIATPTCWQIEVSPRLVAQVVHNYRQRSRVRRAHTKGRAEVRGGGRKPWKQKGTGRSRHGSSRSPIWVGGGITFGPRSHHERIMPQQRVQRRQALGGVFAQHVAASTLEIVRFADNVPSKTKDVIGALHDLRKPLLLIVHANRLHDIGRAARNLPRVQVATAERVTTMQLLQAVHVIVDEAALGTLVQRSGGANE